MAQATAPDFSILAPHFDRYTLLEIRNKSVLPYSYLLQYGHTARQAVLYLVPKTQALSVGWDEVFLANAHAAMKLQHPNLLKVEGAGECGDYYYVIVEYSPDPDLSQAGRLVPASPSIALDCVKGLASGLKQAHALGIVNGRIDRLGIHMNSRYFCRILPLNVRPFRKVPEERDFYAPESLAKGRRPESSDDTYSLGMVLYYLLTGAVPARRKFLMPSCLGDCSKEVDELVARAISPAKGKRFESFSAMLAAIDAVAPNARKEKQVNRFPEQKQIVMVDHGGTMTYFYLIPVLMIAIAMAYVALEYKKDLANLREEHRGLVEKLAKDKSFVPAGTPQIPQPAPPREQPQNYYQETPFGSSAGYTAPKAPEPPAPRPAPSPVHRPASEDRGWSGE